MARSLVHLPRFKDFEGYYHTVKHCLLRLTKKRDWQSHLLGTVNIMKTRGSHQWQRRRDYSTTRSWAAQQAGDESDNHPTEDPALPTEIAHLSELFPELAPHFVAGSYTTAHLCIAAWLSEFGWLRRSAVVGYYDVARAKAQAMFQHGS
jgi:hypothetical protein